ncbi:hypothetical protein [Pseudomonas chlororaphis]|uniref:hypothetical protein n=1 Tax=Pseudomonas chlororaphis TaxID=587753 RepID=UPI0007BB08BF|nr:hypothetical protein [Pseudomonas chlororaphis]AZC64190.1 hypothetical protein C4K33_3701 [Pseudomonas chlororaphis subsp. piscium]AZC70413.1 hypothetical protein C4K32_3754 [Pseudomonas chlororaphis subsp. piscium]KZO48078.1 hypothetical protein PCL1391_3443 [Pseudomonas chlororaphis subsp. piscium]MBP5070972.1 hypothetical protein [Pseudomonas chlororaphis]
MQAIIKYEYLLAPAFGENNEILKIADELSLLSEHIGTTKDSPLIETDLINRMIEAGFYPSEKLFNEKLSQLPDGFPYCAYDIVHMINTITQKGICISDIELNIDIEWETKSITPAFQNTLQSRTEEMAELYERLSISNFFEGNGYSTLYFCPKHINTFCQVSFSGVALDTYPDMELAFPLSVTTETKIFSSYINYLSLLDGHSLFLNARNNAELKKSFFVGALNIACASGDAIKVMPWENFSISDSFLKSLNDNQCAPGMRFGSVLYDAIAHLLVGTPKSDLNIFKKSLSSDEPRTYGNLTAYRTHITKSGRGLRLMLWRDAHECIILANVGNKSELDISKP